MGRDRRFVRKRCDRCGKSDWYGSAPQHCSSTVPRWGGGVVYCGGTLTKVVQPSKPPKPKATPQEIAQKKFEHARQMVTTKIRALARMAGDLRTWESRAYCYAKRSALTDAQVKAERTRRIDGATRLRERKKRRGIKLEGIGKEDRS